MRCILFSFCRVCRITGKGQNCWPPAQTGGGSGPALKNKALGIPTRRASSFSEVPRGSVRYELLGSLFEGEPGPWSWDYIAIARVGTGAEEDQLGKKADAIAKAKGLATGAANQLEFRALISTHTDTYAMGPGASRLLNLAS